MKPLYILISVVILAGCSNSIDPWESYNRVIYDTNDKTDKAVLKPIAETYRDYTHHSIQSGISNFYNNIDDVAVAMNDVLQAEVKRASTDITRILLNSTIGIFGLRDIAGELGYEKNNEDFGQTLAVWGVSSGPYFVLPLFGPSTVRDTTGIIVDSFLDPLYYIEDDGVRYGLLALKVLNLRTKLLSTSSTLEIAALDPYEFTRDAYLQRRAYLISNGKDMPEEDNADDFDDDLDMDDLEEEPLEPTPAN